MWVNEGVYANASTGQGVEQLLLQVAEEVQDPSLFPIVIESAGIMGEAPLLKVHLVAYGFPPLFDEGNIRRYTLECIVEISYLDPPYVGSVCLTLGLTPTQAEALSANR